MAINSKIKGNTFEREVVNILKQELHTTEIKRTPMSGGYSKTIFPGDIIITDPELDRRINTAFECKFHKDWKLENLINGKSCKIFNWMQQAINESNQRTPVLIFKKNHGQIYCAIQEHVVENLPRITIQGSRIDIIIYNFQQYIPLYLASRQCEKFS